MLIGMALVFVYAAGALPETAKDILSLVASVLGLFLGGFVGWVIVLSMYCDKRQGRG